MQAWPLDRILANTVTTPGGCMEWQGARITRGYGHFRENGSTTLAHRAVYQMLHGVELTRWEFVCHSCDNPPCINPDHLWVGSQRENMRDAAAKDRVGRRKLTAAQRQEIVARYRRESFRSSNRKALALEYGVTEGTILDIVGRRRPAVVAA